jgi:hypothetical protein
MAKTITYSSDILRKSLQQYDIQIKVITVMNTRTVIFRVGSSKALVTIYLTKWFHILENQNLYYLDWFQLWSSGLYK